MVLAVESGIELLKVNLRIRWIAVETWGTAIATISEHLKQFLSKFLLPAFSCYQFIQMI
jgi:hypothetical protein